eukprot:COSAG05_NODE_3436_length_2064_cov_2.995420_1_plen_97_part_00
MGVDKPPGLVRERRSSGRARTAVVREGMADTDTLKEKTRNAVSACAIRVVTGISKGVAASIEADTSGLLCCVECYRRRERERSLARQSDELRLQYR